MRKGVELVEVVEHARDGRKGYDVVIDRGAVIRDADALGVDRAMREEIDPEGLTVRTVPDGRARVTLQFEAERVTAAERVPEVLRAGDRVVFSVERARELLSSLLPWDVVALEVVEIRPTSDGARELVLRVPDTGAVSRSGRA